MYDRHNIHILADEQKLWRTDMRFLHLPKNGLEISDAIVAFDPKTLERQPVNKQEIVNHFRAAGNRWAAAIVEAIPAHNHALDPQAVDALLVSIHCEMQRMSEEFQHGQRVHALLKPILHALCSVGTAQPIRIVDIGCGTGFVIRWLAAQGTLGPDVELIGADYHAALVQEAQRLAAAEQLPCSFVVANAFQLTQPATIYISTGILHHFRGATLVNLLSQHNQPETCAFVHFDFQRSPLAPLGSWLFHAVRMRHPLAKHDGVLSAIRAHSQQDLLRAAETGAPDFIAAMYGTRLWSLPIPRAFHALVGLRLAYYDAFMRYYREWSPFSRKMP